MSPNIIALDNAAFSGPLDSGSILARLRALPAVRGSSSIVIIPALRGVEERLVKAAETRDAGALGLPRLLYEKHLAFLASIDPPPATLLELADKLEYVALRLEALLRSGRPGLAGPCLDLGRRMAAICVLAACASLGREAELLEPGDRLRVGEANIQRRVSSSRGGAGRPALASTPAPRRIQRRPARRPA